LARFIVFIERFTDFAILSSMPLSQVITDTQHGEHTVYVNDGRDQPGHYNSTCYVDVEGVTGAPNLDISKWMNQPRTGYGFVGKIHV